MNVARILSQNELTTEQLQCLFGLKSTQNN